MTLEAVLHASTMEHQRRYVAWMIEGLERHGVSCKPIAGYDAPKAADFCVIWGWKQHGVIKHAKARGMPVLVMERGHLQPRMEFTSIGWNGLAGRATYPTAAQCGDRWLRHWGTMAPWRFAGRYALLLGQTPGDASIAETDFPGWVKQVTRDLEQRGYAVKYRPHPNVRETAPLADDLADAEIAVTYNSTSAVEAVLAGVPTIAMDAGSMARPVASSAIDAPLRRPERIGWARDLACCQWNETEIRSGDAWAALREVMPCR